MNRKATAGAVTATANPCGTSVAPPYPAASTRAGARRSGRRACGMCTPAPENAMPARVDASAIAVRASTSLPLETAVRRCPPTSSIARSQSTSEWGSRPGTAARRAGGAAGCRTPRPCPPRSAWHERVDADRRGHARGHETVSIGSTIEGRAAGDHARCPSSSRGGNSMIATVVTSDSVPEVVGRATNGMIGRTGVPRRSVARSRSRAAHRRGWRRAHRASPCRARSRRRSRRSRRSLPASFDGLLDGRLVGLPGDVVVDHRLDMGGGCSARRGDPGTRSRTGLRTTSARVTPSCLRLPISSEAPAPKTTRAALNANAGGVLLAHPAFETGAAASTAPIASSIEITSPYFASMSRGAVVGVDRPVRRRPQRARGSHGGVDGGARTHPDVDAR